MNRISITKRIELVYKIRGYDYLCFGKDKNLYNIRTGKLKKRTLNNCTEGYWIGRKFYSLKVLRLMLEKIVKEVVPF